MIPRVIQQLLGPLHRNRALFGDEAGEPKRFGQGGLLVAQHTADEALGEGLVGAKVAGRQAHVLDPGGAADNLGQARQRANVGGHADVDLLDGEAGVARGDAHVGAARDVDGQAEADAVQDANDGWEGVS